MGQLFTILFADIWNGFKTLPFFQFGFGWDKVLLGMFIIPISIKILKMLFGIGGSEIQSKIGRNARMKRAKLKRKEVQ
jgi:hypothetical protein